MSLSWYRSGQHLARVGVEAHTKAWKSKVEEVKGVPSKDGSAIRALVVQAIALAKDDTMVRV